jgi:hypothetical protein
VKVVSPRRTGLIVGALVAVGCTHTQHIGFAEIKYPKLQSEVCGRADELSQIAVTVQDDFGGAIVYLLPMIGAPPESGPVRAMSDRLGRATLRAMGGSPYAVTVALAGFVPASIAIRFEPGCSGGVLIALKAML